LFGSQNNHSHAKWWTWAQFVPTTLDVPLIEGITYPPEYQVLNDKNGRVAIDQSVVQEEDVHARPRKRVQKLRR
jgi:hypothetical protein